MQNIDTRSDFGILYIATGKKYIGEAIQSAKSVCQIMPQLPLAIFLDDLSQAPVDLFDYILPIENPHFSVLDKVEFLPHTPFQQTLFLDTDTMVIGSIYELQEICQKFDLACAHAPVRITYDIPDCPLAFPELNTGVILYQKCDRVISFFQYWSQLFQAQINSDNPPLHDQPAFRKSLYDSQLNYYILPPEYNLRTVMPMFIGGNARAKILHGREPGLSRLSSQLKQLPLRQNPRVSLLQTTPNQ